MWTSSTSFLLQKVPDTFSLPLTGQCAGSRQPQCQESSSSCALVLLSEWISCFSVPEHITSNSGTRFTSQLWTSLVQPLSTILHYTIAYNSALNGMVERTQCILKPVLMARYISPGWTTQLPRILLGLQTSPKEGINVSPAELVHGELLVVSVKLFSSSRQDVSLEQLRRSVKPFTPVRRSGSETSSPYIPNSLHTCILVFLSVDSGTLKAYKIDI